MNCRALGFAAVLLLVCGGLTRPLQAQENLDAGKSPSQLFAGNCSACHKSPRGLLKTIPAGSLQGFLRQHYTTSPEMAGVLAGFLTANGAGDSRGKSARDGRSETRSEARPETEAAPAGRKHRRSTKHKHGSGDEAAKPQAAGEPSDAPKVAAPRESEPPPTTTQSIPSTPSAGAADPAEH